MPHGADIACEPCSIQRPPRPTREGQGKGSSSLADRGHSPGTVQPHAHTRRSGRGRVGESHQWSVLVPVQCHLPSWCPPELWRRSRFWCMCSPSFVHTLMALAAQGSPLQPPASRHPAHLPARGPDVCCCLCTGSTAGRQAVNAPGVSELSGAAQPRQAQAVQQTQRRASGAGSLLYESRIAAGIAVLILSWL